MPSITKLLTYLPEDKSKRLEEIAVTHIKLAVEVSKRSTSKERREDILKKIKELRAERETILDLANDLYLTDTTKKIINEFRENN